MLVKDPIVETSPLYKQMVGGIYEGAVRLHDIVNSMLDMARIDGRMLMLSMHPVNIPTLIEQVRSNLRQPLEERKMSFINELPQLPLIEGDADELRKVFTHLITNAIKYTPDGGIITITGRVIASHDSRLKTNGVEIVVSDTGIGINPEFHETIFSRFSPTGSVALHSSGKTKFKGGGPGLGLSIARGIVEAHGGQLWVESPGYDEEQCPGSKFYVELPIHPPQQQEADAAP